MRMIIASLTIAAAAAAITAQSAPQPSVKTDSVAGSTAPAADSMDAATAATGKMKKQELRLTVDQLAQYNGQNGRPAYIAVDGIIYDVTNAKGWKDGKHKGFSAGRDVTKQIRKQSPHGDKVLKDNPVVGKLVSTARTAAPAK